MGLRCMPDFQSQAARCCSEKISLRWNDDRGAMARDPGTHASWGRLDEIGACLETIDPGLFCPGGRRTILRRFVADRRAFLASWSTWIRSALAKYDLLETGIPLPSGIVRILAAKETLASARYREWLRIRRRSDARSATRREAMNRPATLIEQRRQKRTALALFAVERGSDGGRSSS